MTDSIYKYGTMATNTVGINERELKQRLGCPPDDVTLIPKCLNTLKKSISFKYTYRFSDININDGVIDLGFAKTASVDLKKNLLGCSRICVFAVTLGSESDRLIMKLSKISPAEAFVTDAIASAMAESLCNTVERLILNGIPHRPRFSPGYGDLPLDIQAPLLSFLNAEKTAGITLSSALLMSPSKSITTIVGII